MEIDNLEIGEQHDRTPDRLDDKTESSQKETGRKTQQREECSYVQCRSSENEHSTWFCTNLFTETPIMRQMLYFVNVTIREEHRETTHTDAYTNHVISSQHDINVSCQYIQSKANSDTDIGHRSEHVRPISVTSHHFN